MNKWFDIKTVKFLFVGVVNTVIGAGVMFVLYNGFKTSYWIATASNYIVGSIVSFFLNKYFTFKNNDKSFTQVLKFVCNISLCYFIAYGAAKPFISCLMTGFGRKVQDNLSMMFGMCLFIVLNYFGQRIFVFKEKKEE